MRIGNILAIGGIREPAPKDMGEAVQKAASDKFKIDLDNITEGKRARITIEQTGNEVVVNFVDKKILDEQNIQILGYQLFNLVDQLAAEENKKAGQAEVILDFSNVEYLSATALGKLIILNKKLGNAGISLKLQKIDPEIYETFEITRLNKLFTIINPPPSLSREYPPTLGF